MLSGRRGCEPPPPLPLCPPSPACVVPHTRAACARGRRESTENVCDKRCSLFHRYEGELTRAQGYSAPGRPISSARLQRVDT